MALVEVNKGILYFLDDSCSWKELINNGKKQGLFGKLNVQSAHTYNKCKSLCL